MDNPAPLTYTIDQCADLLHICRPTMLDLAHSEDFPSFRIGRRLLISAAGLDRWIEEQVAAGHIANENYFADAS